MRASDTIPMEPDHYQELHPEEVSDEELHRQLTEWRNTYFAVYLSYFEEYGSLIWRALSPAEHRNAMYSLDDDFARAEYICRVCTLDPIDVPYHEDNFPAGIPEALCAQILKESGFTDDQSKFHALMSQNDDDMTRLQHQVAPIICAAFPQYYLEDVEYWTMDRSMWYFSRATWVLREIRGVNLEFQSDEDNQAPY